MLERIKEGYDIVIGSRFVRIRKDSSMRMIGSRMITVAIKLTTKVRISDPTSGMRMFSRKMIEEFAQNLNYGLNRTLYHIWLKMVLRFLKCRLLWMKDSLG